jgi:hypothetical protein
MNPNMINQNFFDGVVGCPISNLMIYMSKLLERCQSRFRSDQLILKISPLIIDAIITLPLNDHGVYDHTSSHDLPYSRNTPLPNRMPDNGPTKLENTKYSLHSLPASLMFFCKPLVFLFLGITTCLHKNMPLQIDTTS